MSRRNWKRVHPNSLRDALRLCKDHALEKRRYTVERIADLMSVTPDALYKWLATGKMPANHISSYEHICGINLVTRWLSTSAGFLVIEPPTGRNVKAADMQELQELLTTAVGSLLRFYDKRADATEALASIQQGMEGLAWHRVNVEKHLQPELELTRE